MDIFVKRPVIAIVISLVLLLFGALSALNISVSQFPQIESTSLLITTEYTGASAKVVQGFITDPIERAASTIPSIDYVDSTTTAGRSVVTVWLKLNENTTAALAQLSSRLSQVSFELPPDAQDPAINVQRADRQTALFYLNVYSDRLNRAELTDYLTRQVNPLLASIEGVERIDLFGGRNPAMRIWIDPVRMASMNISSQEIFIALQSNNVTASIGKTENNLQEVNLLSNATLQNEEDFRKLVVRKVDNTLIRLGDVADVELGEDRGSMSARLDQNSTIFIGILPLPGSNEIAIGDEVYKRLESINATLPEGMEITIVQDATIYMRAALNEILTTLFETIFLVGLVVLALMGSFRSALVPLVTIPISILGSIAMMTMMGFSLNLLTILAIVLSVGLVVDDAIVVVENVSRHLREGKSRINAALISSRELLAPIIAMTITLSVVYVPIGFVSGLLGSLFKEFAFTLAVAVLISGIVAITLSPIMSAYVCAEKGKENKITRRVNDFFDKFSASYGAALRTSFVWKPQILLMGLFLSLLIVPFYLFSAKELAPVEDQGSIFLITEAAPDASLENSTDYMYDVIDAAYTFDGIDEIWQIVNPNTGISGINFKDYSERMQSVHEVLPQMFKKLSSITGFRTLPILPAALPTAGQFEIEMVIQSSDSYEEMEQYSNQLLAAANQSGDFLFARTTLNIDLPQVRIDFDHDRIADLGLDTDAVIVQISSMISEQEVNRFEADGKSYRVIPSVNSANRQNPDSLLDLNLKIPTGELIPLRSFAKIERVTSPRILGKFNQQQSFRILGGPLPGVTTAQALAGLETAAKEILPESYTINYAGISRQLTQEGNSILSVLLVAMAIVYLVLAVQFNSFKAPLVVLVGSVPLALSGAMLFSFLSFTSINIYVQIGFITLVGLVAKNGILITEFANELQLKGESKVEAIVNAAQTRLRPIIMTTLATVFGHFPLVLVTGAGAEARNSIGIILVAGMIIGTVFTLFVLPCVYLLFGDNLATEGNIEPNVTVLQVS